MSKIALLTGATGFVGGAVLKSLNGYRLKCFGRSRPNGDHFEFHQGQMNDDNAIKSAFQGGVDIVIHTAARAHVMNENDEEAMTLYRDINVTGTLNIARHAAEAGVKRFIFLSSIKVNGESTAECKPFVVSDTPAPVDPYGVSKYEAEKGLKDLSNETGMEVVIIRPPLVYGPGVKANFAAMMKLAKKNLPLPLGAIKNKRSLVSIGNLVDLIETCISHPAAANKTFLVSDDRDISTTELLSLMTRSMGKKPRLIPVPKSWLYFAGTLTGKQAIIERLCGNLQVDISETKKTLNWQPALSVEEGIKRCIDDSFF